MIIVADSFFDALLKTEALMVLPFGCNDAKQTSHAELLNPTAPTNEYPSIFGTSMEKLSPLFESTVIDLESVETLTKGDIEN